MNVACTYCHTISPIEGAKAGTSVACPSCSRSVLIPTRPPTPEELAASTAARQAAARAARPWLDETLPTDRRMLAHLARQTEILEEFRTLLILMMILGLIMGLVSLAL